jgi:hypothetical protein
LRTGYTPPPSTATPAQSSEFQIDRFKNE